MLSKQKAICNFVAKNPSICIIYSSSEGLISSLKVYLYYGALLITTH